MTYFNREEILSLLQLIYPTQIEQSKKYQFTPNKFSPAEIINMCSQYNDMERVCALLNEWESNEQMKK